MAPPVFDLAALLLRLEAIRDGERDPWQLQAQALLYTKGNQVSVILHEKMQAFLLNSLWLLSLSPECN